MSSTCCSASSSASATSSSAAIAGAAQPRGRRLGGHRDRQADQRAAQADGAAAVDRLEHAVGRHLADPLEPQQLLARERVEVRRALEQAGLVEALDPHGADRLDVGGGARGPVDQPPHRLGRAGDVGAEQLAAVALLGQRLPARRALAPAARSRARRRCAWTRRARRPRTGSRRRRGARAPCRRCARRGRG